MNDDVKGDLMQRSREWLQSCVNAATRSGVPEEADLEAFILAHLDGEAARTAAAVAAAREEQRRLDAQAVRDFMPPYLDMTAAQALAADAPLTATPLADRIAELEASNDAQWEETAHLAGARAEKAEAERDAWKAKAIRDPSQLAETLWSECYADLAAANVQNIAERDAAIQESVRLIGHRNEIRAERDALRAQVEAARALAAERDALRAQVTAAGRCASRSGR